MSRNQAAVAHRRMASMPPLDLFLFMIFIASSVVFNMMFFPGSQLSQEELISAPRVTNAAVYDKTAVHRLVRMVYGEAGVALIAQQSFLDQNILIKNAMSTLNEYFFLISASLKISHHFLTNMCQTLSSTWHCLGMEKQQHM
jgi:hypothetical protein